MKLILYSEKPGGPVLLRVRVYGYPPAQLTPENHEANASYFEARESGALVGAPSS